MVNVLESEDSVLDSISASPCVTGGVGFLRSNLPRVNCCALKVLLCLREMPREREILCPK